MTPTPLNLQVLATQWLLPLRGHHNIKEAKSKRKSVTTVQNLTMDSKHRATSARPPAQSGGKCVRYVGQRITPNLHATTKQNLKMKARHLTPFASLQLQKTKPLRQLHYIITCTTGTHGSSRNPNHSHTFTSPSKPTLREHRIHATTSIIDHRAHCPCR
jgi:hypothetical protein